MRLSKKLLTVTATVCLGAFGSFPTYAESIPDSYGPARLLLEAEAAAQDSKLSEPAYEKGKSLGIFTTSGYCSCSICSGSSSLTYTGVLPQAGHTISADLTVLPLGTRVFIDDTVYTVEDMGSHVDGNLIDIFYDTHAEAKKHGIQQQEVFLAE